MAEKIISNYHHKQFVYRHDVPQSVLTGDLDWTDDDDHDHYLQYKGYWYHLSQFMRLPTDHDWHGAHCEGYFSGILIRIADDCETYQIARYLS